MASGMASGVIYSPLFCFIRVSCIISLYVLYPFYDIDVDVLFVDVLFIDVLFILRFSIYFTFGAADRFYQKSCNGLRVGEHGVVPGRFKPGIAVGPAETADAPVARGLVICLCDGLPL
jgi:hypothetical protein